MDPGRGMLGDRLDQEDRGAGTAGKETKMVVGPGRILRREDDRLDLDEGLVDQEVQAASLMGNLSPIDGTGGDPQTQVQDPPDQAIVEEEVIATPVLIYGPAEGEDPEVAGDHVMATDRTGPIVRLEEDPTTGTGDEGRPDRGIMGADHEATGEETLEGTTMESEDRG